MPSRASSCSRRPSTLSADTIGGTCSMSPVRWAATTAPGVVEGHRCHVVRRRDRAVGVERVGLHAEHDLAGVLLAAVADEAHQAGRPSRPRRRARRSRSGRACRRGRSGARPTGAAACRRRRGSSPRRACRRSPGRGPSAGAAEPSPGQRSAGRSARRMSSMRSAATDHVVGTELQDRRLLGLDLAVDRCLHPPAVLVEHLDDRRSSASSSASESKNTIARFSSLSTSSLVIVTNASRSSSMRTNSSAITSRSVSLTRALRG